MDDDGDDEIFIEGLDPHRKLVIRSEMDKEKIIDNEKIERTED